LTHGAPDAHVASYLQHASSAKSVSTKAPRQGLSQRHAPIVPQDFTPLALETSDVPVVIMASLLLRWQQPPVLVVPLENMPPQSGPQLVPTAQQVRHSTLCYSVACIFIHVDSI